MRSFRSRCFRLSINWDIWEQPDANTSSAVQASRAIKPQEGIYFFLEGDSGQLRYHNIRSSCDLDNIGFDTDRTFMLVEVAGDKLYFQTISRSGAIIDSGELSLQKSKQK